MGELQFNALETVYRRFDFRSGKIAAIAGEIVMST
jgi:hypothetical protein